MRPGGGKYKGSKWERDTGRLLSLWLTNSERGDIFSRNVLSGGSFTMAEAANRVSSRMPGDLMMAHPLAFRFLKVYSVECKHLKDIGLTQFLLDPRMTTPLGRIISLAKKQARHMQLGYMVIAKENRREALVFTNEITGDKILTSLRPVKIGGRVQLRPMHHWLHGGQIFVIRFSEMLARVDPDLFLGE